MNALRRLIAEEEGADATEYALLAALIAVAIMVGASNLAGGVNNIFNAIGTKLTNTNVS